jgi:hypothetical protein
LMAIAVFGIILVRDFDARVKPALDRIGLAATERAAADRELPKLAGASIDAWVEPSHRAAVRTAIDASFVSAFRLVMTVAAGVALGAAVIGALIR